jgi:sporulation protein YlmC with PRC-barrel domain
MRLKQLRGMPVVDPTTARKIGSVLDYQVDPVAGQVAAIDVGDVGGEARRIGAERIHRVGAAAVMLTAASAADTSVPAAVADDWLDAASLSGLEVMGVDGGRIGRLSDAAFNQDDLTIEFYELRLNILQRLARRPGRILPNAIESCSRELMLLSTPDLGSLPSQSADTDNVAAPSLPVALKVEDRLIAPGFEQTPDSQPVVARTR